MRAHSRASWFICILPTSLHDLQHAFANPLILNALRQCRHVASLHDLARMRAPGRPACPESLAQMAGLYVLYVSLRTVAHPQQCRVDITLVMRTLRCSIGEVWRRSNRRSAGRAGPGRE